MRPDEDSAKITFPPPLIFFICVLAGVLVRRYFPLRIYQVNLFLPGWILILVGVFTISYCAWFFNKEKTSILPWKSTNKIVVAGPYRFSRNPIYVSMVVIGIGIALVTNNPWVILSQVIFVVLIHHFVIAREEKYLEGKFGDDYRGYKMKVRRWV